MESIVCVETIHWGKPEEWPLSVQYSPGSSWSSPGKADGAGRQSLDRFGVVHALYSQRTEWGGACSRQAEGRMLIFSSQRGEAACSS